MTRTAPFTHHAPPPYLIVLAILDSFVLTFGSPEFLLLGRSLVLESDGSFRLLTFIPKVCWMMEPWVLVNMTAERLTAVYVPHKMRVWLSRGRAGSGLAVTLICCGVFNYPSLLHLEIGESAEGGNLCRVSSAFNGNRLKVWTKARLVLTNVLTTLCHTPGLQSGYRSPTRLRTGRCRWGITRGGEETEGERTNTFAGHRFRHLHCLSDALDYMCCIRSLMRWRSFQHPLIRHCGLLGHCHKPCASPNQLLPYSSMLAAVRRSERRLFACSDIVVPSLELERRPEKCPLITNVQQPELAQHHGQVVVKP